jgi:SPP1 gp7 family putative phage head morphogenesis protein
MAVAPRFADELLSWDEIERAFADRLEITAEAFYALQEEYRGLAFTVSQLSDMQTLARVKRRLQQSIERGEQLADFLTWVEGDALGWTDAYAGLVFRNNVFSAAARGRWQEIEDPDVADEFPFLMYDAVDDARTRDEHARMDGRAWPRDEFPDEWCPLCGHNCRCSLRQLNESLLRRTGARLQTSGPPDGIQPDEGFRTNQNRAGVLEGMLSDELDRMQWEVAR